MRRCVLLICFTFVFILPTMAQSSSSALKLTNDQAADLAKIALRGIQQEFPNKTGHVINDKADVKGPKQLHPAFYGCFDWHSAVHSHWMLTRLLKLFPDLKNAQEIRRVLGRHLTAKNLQAEADYFGQPNRKSFERTYGWAWLLKLAQELHTWDDPDGKKWAKNLKPLTDVLVKRYLEFLPKQTYPIRTPVHPNTAFGLAFAWDYATTVKHERLKKLIEKRSRDYFAKDVNVPASWEPGGDDFFSPSLMEASLMRRVLAPKEFQKWLTAFLPDLADGKPKSLLTPAIVSDRSDPKIVHLDGLNLSRGWCMKSIVSGLPEKDPRQMVLLKAAERHAKAALPHVASGEYEGEHWLASFAVHLLSVELE